MVDPKHNAIIRELVARGLIAAQPGPRILPQGNVDRRSEGARAAWHAVRPDGTAVKLTLGADLADLAKRHGALAEACPGLVPPLLYFEHLTGGSVLAEPYFEGPTLETALTASSLPLDTLRKALGRAESVLAATEHPSDKAARREEWATWSASLLTLPVWADTERSILRDQVLPGLYALISSTASTTRWSNGDFTAGNLLVNAHGDIRLIDFEFAARTHFFAEDAVRFRVLSSAARDRPELDAVLPPQPSLAWHLFFWLRQFQLETGHNTPEYQARFKSARLGLIRGLAEHVLGLDFPGWSTPALTLEHRVEDLRWSEDTGRAAVVTGWCCPPDGSVLRGIVALGPDGCPLATAHPSHRPDVQRHFGGDPLALSTGFVLRLSPKALESLVTLCAWIDQGTLLPFRNLNAADLPRGLCWDNYPAWAAKFDPDPAATVTPATSPLFSILLPVYRTPEAFLHECLNSVLTQHYPHWELCVVDDGSASSGLTASLNRLAAADPRIRVNTRQENGGISRATNDALAMAQGEFVVLLDHDDLLRPHALAAFATEVNRRPNLDALYSDEDKITADGRRVLPFLKPDFSPEFLCGVMYAGHALCVRTSVARAVGGFDPSYDGVQDFEFFLRVTEQTGRIGHIPRMLYHWRQSAGSSALHGNVKGDMDERQAAAVQAHLKRIGDPRRAVALGGHRVRLEATTFPTHELVRTHDHTGLPALLRRHAKSSQADVLVLITPGIVAESGPWLQELLALAALADSGCIAPVLLSPDGRVRESGRVGTQPIMCGFHPEGDGYHGSLRCNREVDAVSPACVAIRRMLLLEPPETPNDDWPGFCQHLRARGLYHRVCAAARVQLTDPSPSGSTVQTTNVSGTGEFYNPQFNPLTGDYTLANVSSLRKEPISRLQFNIEQPQDWSQLPRCLIIRGWCFSGPSEAIRAIRLRAGDLTLTGVTGLTRPDVKAALPEAPDDNTGFEIRGTLPAGRIRLGLEAQLPDGNWHELVAHTVEVKRQFLPLWLGGGDWMELMFFQMPAHMAYPARPVRPETFPAARAGAPVPKFSIVTPSYNQARFLAETMGSVLGQAGVDCSYVVQDGGSTDGSVALIERVAAATEAGDGRQEAGAGAQQTEGRGRKADGGGRSIQSPVSGLRSPVRPRLLQWSSEPDSGQADAIAKGFAKTSGGPDDIMTWINSDDFYLPGALAYVADYFARHPEVDVVYGHRILVDENSQEIGRWFLPKHDDEVLRLNDFVPQETLFWRRRIWEKAGGIDPAFKFALDWDLLLRFQAAGASIVRVPYFLACFRIHSAQKTSAQMHSVGQGEITRLRERTFGRPFPPQELEQNPRLLRYLRQSAFIEFLWKLGIRA